MKQTIDYSQSPSPGFDAIEDIKSWLGDHWESISLEMAKVTDQKQFRLLAYLAGIQGYPVKAWYELYHGQNSWKDPQ